LCHAREGNAAGAAISIRVAEEGNSYFGHEETPCYICLW
jgi:hypothetical protein